MTQTKAGSRMGAQLIPLDKPCSGKDNRKVIHVYFGAFITFATTATDCIRGLTPDSVRDFLLNVQTCKEFWICPNYTPPYVDIR